MIDRWLSFGLMAVTSVNDNPELLRQRSAGMIVAEQGALKRIEGVWFPRRATVWRTWLDQRARHLPADQCRIYFRQPLSSPTYLAIDYFVSGSRTSLRTVDAALEAIDQIAQLKRSDAIVAQLKNSRISTRMLQRYGWERHLGGEQSLHIIKRFYGKYPASKRDLRESPRHEDACIGV
jgi:hypothetical protein